MLTDTAVKKAKAADKIRTMSDGGGLQLRISSTGTKTWRLAYRYNGAQKTMIFGTYPTTTLSEARQKRDEAKKLLASGKDPGAARRETKIAAKVETNSTLKAVAEGYFQKLTAEGRAAVTLDKNRWLFAFIPSDLGAKPVSEIRAPDLLPTLRVLEARGLTQSAGRLRGLLGAIFRYGAANGQCESDPTSLLHGALARHETKSRAAVTDVKKFGALIRAVWSYEGQPETVIPPENKGMRT